MNPGTTRILGVPTFPSVSQIPGRVNLAVLAVPASAVPDVARDCGEAGVKGLIVIAAGFAELGSAGKRLEQSVTAIAARYGMRVLGPNCLGVMDPISKLNASFGGQLPEPGQVAVLSQSGAMCTAILDWAHQERLGFARFISLGNKSDVTEDDFLEEWTSSNEISTVVGYLESISDGERFIRDAAALTRRKPFVLLKGGVSDSGGKAASSHTGALTGSEDVLETALRQAGVTRAHSIEELFDLTSAFAKSKLPAGKRTAIITNAGGPGVVTTDAVSAAGLSLAKLRPVTQRRLRRSLPVEANVHNPVDCIGDARADRYEAALQVVLKDPGVDAVIVLLTPQGMTEIPETARVIAAHARTSRKPVLASFIGGVAVAAGTKVLREAGVPEFPSPERAVGALRGLAEYAAYRRGRTQLTHANQPKRVLQTSITRHKPIGHIAGIDTSPFLREAGIRGSRMLLADSAAAVVKAARLAGYPVVMKVDSPDVLHKTDVGGVVLDVKSAGEARAAYTRVLKNVSHRVPAADIRGVTIEALAKDGQDVLVGAKRDPVFGPVVTFGFGGIYTEVMHDVAFGIAPLNRQQSLAMIGRTKSAALLRGARGQQGLDIEAVVAAIMGVSQLIAVYPEIQEIDINPLRVYRKGAQALDVRIILK